MGVALGFGARLGGCRGVLGVGAGLGRLVGWRGHFDGMGRVGDRERRKVRVSIGLVESRNGG